MTDPVNGLTEGKDTDYDKVVAIYDHFSAENGFTYTLQTAGRARQRPGHRQLPRQQAGLLPAVRRGDGLAGPGRRHPGPGGVRLHQRHQPRRQHGRSLTNLNLHAWTEVYFGPASAGCRSTRRPGASVPGSTRPAWAPDPNALPQQPRRRAGAVRRAGCDASARAPPARTRSAGRLDESGAAGAARRPAGPTWPMYLLGAVIVLLALLATPALRRSLLRRRRQSDHGRRPPAMAATGSARDRAGRRDGGGHRRARRPGYARTRTPPGTS